MENQADILETQVPSNEQKDRQIQFSICLFSFNKGYCFSPIATKKQMENLIIDLSAHLAELEVLKYLPRFPYWSCSSKISPLQ